MPFPCSITGTIEVTTEQSAPITVDEVIQQIEWLLDDGKARSIFRNGPILRFRGSYYPLWFNMNTLAGVESGRIRVETRGPSIFVDYDLSNVRLLGILVALSLSPLGFTLLSSSAWSGEFIRNVIDAYNTQGVMTLMLISWLWILPGRYLMTKFRFRGWLVRGLSTAFSSACVQAVRR